MEPKYKYLVAFSTVRIQFLVLRNRTLLGFGPTKRDDSRKLVRIYCRWHVIVHLEHREADQGSGDSGRPSVKKLWTRNLGT